MNAPFRFWILILTIASAGLALRLHFAGEPLWLDELHTAWCVDAELSDVSVRAGQGNQTPLFFLLTRLITWALASTPLTLRLASIICGTLAILGSAVWVYRWKQDVWAASLTAVLVAIDPWLMFYSSEARPYAMLQALALLQFLTFLSLVYPAQPDQDKSDPLKHVCLKLLSFLLLATHLTGGLLILTEFILLLLVRPRHSRLIVLSLVVGSVIAIPLLLFSGSVFNHRSQWQSDSGLHELFSNWRHALLFQLTPGIAVLAYGSFQKRGKDKSDNCIRNSLLLVTAWAFIPLGLALLLHCFSIPLASYRYTSVASLAPPICVGLAAAVITQRSLAIAFLTATLIVNVVFHPVVHAVVKNQQLPVYRNENWQSTVNYVNQLNGEPDLVFLMSNLYEDSRALEDQSIDFQNYLKFPVSSIYPLSDRFEIVAIPSRNARVLSEDQIENCADHRGAIFICRVTNQRMQQIRNELKTVFVKRQQDVQIETMEQTGNILKVVVITFTK